MRKQFLLTLVASGALWAQQSTVTFSTAGRDVNGRPIPGPAFAATARPGDSTRTELSSSINGRTVPREQVEDKLISQSGNTKVVERTVRRFDQNGNPGPAEKQQIEETKRSDGTSSVKTTTYRQDLNGNLALAERSVTETEKRGATTTTSTAVERPTLNGGLSLTEKQVRVREELGQDAARETTEVVQRNANGNFQPLTRTVAEQKKENGVVVENKAQFESFQTGQLQLTGQTVRRTEKLPDGTEVQLTDVYSTTLLGRAQDTSNPQPRLREQDVVQRRKAPDGSVVETVDVRRVDPSNLGRLSSPQRIAETVCKGNCGAP